MSVLKIVNHSHTVLSLAVKSGWLVGARYTNLRDTRRIGFLHFLDIDWQNYSFEKHLEVAARTMPVLTVARDILRARSLDRVLAEAEKLQTFCRYVIIVPKDPRLADAFTEIPKRYILGYSVPTRYGGTRIPPDRFRRRVHLLGGRPDVQRRLARQMPVVSVDCNRFTLDAKFGDYFDGEIFRPHPIGGYKRCLADSIKRIDRLWSDYQCKRPLVNTR